MSVKSLILGGMIGYVLGTKAGRGRYEQIMNVSSKLWNSKPVQAGKDKAHDVASDAFEGAKTKVTDKIHQVRGEDAPIDAESFDF